MSTRPLQVLLDISYGALGYSGIPQETRLLLRVLAECHQVETTALIYGINNTRGGRRLGRLKSREKLLESQALYLRRLIDGDSATTTRLGAGWSKICTWWQTLFGGAPRFECMDSHFFWDQLWRRWLAPSLTDDEIELAQNTNVLLSNLNRFALTFRAIAGLAGPRFDTRAFDFALFHEARAIRLSPSTCKLIRHYDMIPVVRPDIVTTDHHIKAHMRAILSCRNDSIFVCISEAAREDLLQIFPELTERCVTIPCTLAEGYFAARLPSWLPQIVRSRRCSAAAKHPATVLRQQKKGKEFPPYLLMVSTIEPRKNHVALIRAFEEVLAKHRTDLNLVVVGSPGWKYTEAQAAMMPLIRRGRLFHLEKVPQNELRVLYSHARAVIFPSLYEGFGYTPLEAMCCETPAIASNIAAHRWAYGDAALYCDPYRIDSIVQAIEQLCIEDDSPLRRELIQRGSRRVARYRISAVSVQWEALLWELRRQGIGRDVENARLAAFNEQLRRIEEQQEHQAREVDQGEEPPAQAA
jgi:glycosyltransferase involved in cell wall biosynthesis